MKDPKRINRISKLIGKIWRKNPSLRLCQLIGNCFNFSTNDTSIINDLYYIEDDELERRLREIYKEE